MTDRKRFSIKSSTKLSMRSEKTRLSIPLRRDSFVSNCQQTDPDSKSSIYHTVIPPAPVKKEAIINNLMSKLDY